MRFHGKIFLVFASYIYLSYSFIANHVKISHISYSQVSNDDMWESTLSRLPTTYPKFNVTEQDIARSMIDISKIKPDDPIFIDMSWPDQRGELATAFAKHLQWRRRLSDGERKRWLKWAVYQRSQDRTHYHYNIDDFIKQNLLKILSKRGLPDRRHKSIDGKVWLTLKKGMEVQDVDEVTATMKAFYNAFNKRRYDDLQLLLLPDEDTEAMYPGYGRVRGHFEVDKLLRRLIRESKPFGKVDADIVSVKSFGNVAVVYTVEKIGKGKAIKRAGRPDPTSLAPVAKPMPFKKVLATTVLRYTNKQWRIQVHHCTPFVTSVYTENPIPLLAQPEVDSQTLARASDFSGKITNWADMRDMIMKRDLNPPVMIKEKKRLEKKYSADTPSAKVVPEPMKKTDMSVANSLKSLIGEEKRKMRTLSSTIIDPEASISRQTIQALRYLAASGQISKDIKDSLIASMVNSAVEKKESLIETSFKVIYAQRTASDTYNNKLVASALQDFADQCVVASRHY